MKKVLLSLVAALAIGAGSASAQSPELTLSYGGYTQMDACNNHDGWNHVNNAWGALNVGLNFNVLPRLWIGRATLSQALPPKAGLTIPISPITAYCSTAATSITATRS